ncbi:MAG: glycine cleavage system protein GcvH [Rhodomicrobium sp.]|jgi:glycine cleavage system H protein
MALTKYTEDHEYVRVENGIGTVGITNYAAEKLGDVTFVELPAKGEKIKKGSPVAVVESVKAASDIYAPASGVIVEVNEELNDKPELINQEAEGAGWILKIEVTHPEELDKLMDLDPYLEYAKAEG